MKRAMLTLGLLVACTAILLGCDSNDKPNPVDENVPDTQIKQGESVNPDELDLFKDEPSKNDDADKDSSKQSDLDLSEPKNQGPPVEQPKLKIPGGSGDAGGEQ